MVKTNNKISIFAMMLWIIIFLLITSCTHHIGKPKACTQEAKICPDGSVVGRTGPNCEFAKCPYVVMSQASLGAPFKIALQQNIAIPLEKLSFKFYAVTEDSRCPIDVRCVWAGRAVIALEVTKNGENTATFELTNGDSNIEISEQYYEGYVIKFLNINSSPVISTKPTQNYVATLIVSKSNNMAGRTYRSQEECENATKQSCWFQSCDDETLYKCPHDSTGWVPKVQAARATDSITELKYKLIEKFNNYILVCGPPVEQIDYETQQLEKFDDIEKMAEFNSILSHKGLTNSENWSKESKLIVIKEHERLSAIVLEPFGNKHKFNLVSQGFQYEGYITPDGEIEITKKQEYLAGCPPDLPFQ